MMSLIQEKIPHIKDQEVIYEDFRPGDIMHSFANISKANALLGYEPTHDIDSGLRASLDWYIKNLT